MTAPAIDAIATTPASDSSSRSDASPPEWRVVAALGRSEARRLVLRPSMIIAAALGIMMSGEPSGRDVIDRTEESTNSAFVFLLLAAVTLIASHRAATRAQRDGTEEVVDGTPAGSRARTGSHLLAVAGPTAIALLTLAAFVAMRVSAKPVGDWQPLELATGPTLVAGAGALGVLLARLWSHAFVPFAACVVIGFVEGNMTGEPLIHTPWRQLAFWVEGSDQWLLTDRHPAAHLMYLVGLVSLACLAALLRHGRTRGLTVVSLAAIAVTVSAAAVQVTPLPQDYWDRGNELVSNPASGQTCDTRAGVRYCMLKPDLVDVALAPAVRSLRAAVPEEAWPSDVAVSQELGAGDLQYTTSKIQEMVPAVRQAKSRLYPNDGVVRVGLGWGWSSTPILGFGVGMASRVVGLPTGPDGRSVCSAAGQARGALALYLGGLTHDRAANHVRGIDAPRGKPALFTLTEVDVFGGAAFGVEDARLAAALLAEPTDSVRKALATHWPALVDRRTTTGDAARLLGVAGTFTAPAGPRRDITRSPVVEVGGPCV